MTKQLHILKYGHLPEPVLSIGICLKAILGLFFQEIPVLSGPRTKDSFNPIKETGQSTNQEKQHSALLENQGLVSSPVCLSCYLQHFSSNLIGRKLTKASRPQIRFLKPDKQKYVRLKAMAYSDAGFVTLGSGAMCFGFGLYIPLRFRV